MRVSPSSVVEPNGSESQWCCRIKWQWVPVVLMNQIAGSHSGVVDDKSSSTWLIYSYDDSLLMLKKSFEFLYLCIFKSHRWRCPTAVGTWSYVVETGTYVNGVLIYNVQIKILYIFSRHLNNTNKHIFNCFWSLIHGLIFLFFKNVNNVLSSSPLRTKQLFVFGPKYFLEISFIE